MTFDEWWEQRVSDMKKRYPEHHYSQEFNRSVKESHRLAWNAALDNMVENNSSYNTQSTK